MNAEKIMVDTSKTTSVDVQSLSDASVEQQVSNGSSTGKNPAVGLTVSLRDSGESISEDGPVAKNIKNMDADITLKLMDDWDSKVGPLTPEAEKKLRWKIKLTVFPILFAVNFMLFMDKNAMGYASLLGLFEDADIDQAKYNNLQTIFYVGYIVSEVPSHFVFQKLPLSKYVSGVTFIWAFLTLIQLTVKNFSGLAAIRFFLGVFESGITPCIEQTMGMWFTPDEQAIVNPVFWISCLAVGIPGGLISYGVQFVEGVSPWRVYWAIIGALTFVLSVSTFFFYPDNPASYRFFTLEERVQVIRRVKKATHSSIEQKTIKKYQIVEALKDPITWLFALHVLFLMLSNNISFQSAIIYQNLGFSNLNSTLVAVASAGWSTVCSIAGSIMLKFYRSQTAHVGTFFCMISLLGGILVVSLPLDNSYGILAGIFLANASGVCFIGAFSWSQSSAAGYTKRLTRTIVWSVAYGIVNLFASQLWRSKDEPRYYPAWITIIVGSYVIAPCILQIIRYILNKRNIERKEWLKNSEDGSQVEYGYVTLAEDEGLGDKKKVDMSMLDLTDKENKKFIYPL